MVLLAKIGLPLLAVGLGGGVILGATKTEINAPQTKPSTVALEEPREAEGHITTHQVPELIQETPSASQEAHVGSSPLRQEEAPSPDVELEKEGAEGNCEVVTDFQAVMDALSLKDDSYVSFSCDVKGINSDTDEVFSDKWEGKWVGLFPRDLFKKGGQQLIKGYKLDIKTNTEEQEQTDTEELYKTTFQSDLFASEKQIAGKWDDGNDRYDEKLVDFVKINYLKVQNNIYFVHEGGYE